MTEWNDTRADTRGDMGIGHRRYTREQMLASLRRVAAELGQTSLAKNEYGQHFDPTRDPTWIRICQVFEFWNAAVAAAGLTPIAPVKDYERRWTEQDCIDAVAIAAADISPKRLCYLDYQAIYIDLQLADGRPLPSPQTVRNYVGTWREVRLRAGLPA